MPPLMTNSKDGQVHKDKYLDTSTKILSQEMIICNMKSLIFIILLWIMFILKKICQVSRSKGLVNTKRSSMKILSLIVEKLLG